MSLHSSTTFRAREVISVLALRLFRRMLQAHPNSQFRHYRKHMTDSKYYFKVIYRLYIVYTYLAIESF